MERHIPFEYGDLEALTTKEYTTSKADNSSTNDANVIVGPKFRTRTHFVLLVRFAKVMRKKQ